MDRQCVLLIVAVGFDLVILGLGRPDLQWLIQRQVKASGALSMSVRQLTVILHSEIKAGFTPGRFTPHESSLRQQGNVVRAGTHFKNFKDS